MDSLSPSSLLQKMHHESWAALTAHQSGDDTSQSSAEYLACMDAFGAHDWNTLLGTDAAVRMAKSAKQLHDTILCINAESRFADRARRTRFDRDLKPDCLELLQAHRALSVVDREWRERARKKVAELQMANLYRDVCTSLGTDNEIDLAAYVVEHTRTFTAKDFLDADFGRRIELLHRATMAAAESEKPTETANESKASNTDGSDIEPPSTHVIAVDLSKLTVTLNGTEHDISSPQALRWVQVLLSNPGEWISVPELEKRDKELLKVRTDRLRMKLPECLRKLIETHKSRGSRIVLKVAQEVQSAHVSVP